MFLMTTLLHTFLLDLHFYLFPLKSVVSKLEDEIQQLELEIAEAQSMLDSIKVQELELLLQLVSFRPTHLRRTHGTICHCVHFLGE